MAFSLPRFLRRTPLPMIEEYLRHRDVLLPDTLDLDAETDKQIRAMAVSIEELDARERDAIHRDLENVHQLVGEAGQRALQSAVSPAYARWKQLEELEGDEARGLRVLMDDEPAFERALAVHEADQYRHGRSWSGYLVERGLAPVADRALNGEFAQELKEVFRRPGGTTREIRVESFERAKIDKAGRNGGVLLQCTVYVEGDPENWLELSKSALKREVRRPAFEAAVIHDREDGVLDVVAAGGSPIRQRIARAFAQHVLSDGHSLEAVRLREYQLDILKRRHALTTDPSDGIARVKLIALRLLSDAAGHGRVTLELGPQAELTLWEASSAWFGDEDPLTGDDWQVRQAKLKVEFRPEPGRARCKVLNVDLRIPNGCNLKDQTQRERLLTERYLGRWGLLRDLA